MGSLNRLMPAYNKRRGLADGRPVKTHKAPRLNSGQTNRLLGYPVDARLLIINADDFGMCHAINEAVVSALEHGVLRSTTLMVPCPWALHAIHFLADHPEIPFGIHLTAISDWPDYRWGPVTPREKVPSLIDPAGYFY